MCARVSATAAAEGTRGQQGPVWRGPASGAAFQPAVIPQHAALLLNVTQLPLVLLQIPL